MNSNRVFVYGTLRKGRGNHHRLGDAKFLGTLELIDKWHMVSLGSYPGVVRGDKRRPVMGEVYEISDKALQEVDWLEGHPSYYQREEVETAFGTAWVYMLPERYGKYTEIPSGDWFNTDREWNNEDDIPF